MGEPRVLGFRPLCRGRRFVFGQVEAVVNGRRTLFDALQHPGAVAVLAVDDSGRVLLERQYRPVVGRWLYEVPAGTVEEGEDPFETAVRELEEETGFRARHWCRLLEFYPSPGVSMEKIVLYRAWGLESGVKRLEEDEVIESVFVPLEEALDMIRRGEIVDAKTIIALLAEAQGVKCRG